MPLAIRIHGFVAACVCLCACGAQKPPSKEMNDRVIAAVKANDVEAVQALLQNRAPVDARGSGDGADEGYTALLYAVERRYLPLARLLLRSGADPNLPGGHQNVFPLLTAAGAGERDLIALLLDYRANINQKRPDDGMDALAAACFQGHLTIVDLLMARNAVAEPQDLGFAIGGGHTQVVERLLKAGANPAWTVGGRTMTQIARESPRATREEMMALLRR